MAKRKLVSTSSTKNAADLDYATTATGDLIARGSPIQRSRQSVDQCLCIRRPVLLLCRLMIP